MVSSSGMRELLSRTAKLALGALTGPFLLILGVERVAEIAF